MTQSYEQFANVYDELMKEMPYDQWLQFANQVWDRYGIPHSVVDLGCGTGAISIPLAQAGYQVTGIDLSSHMLSIAGNKQKQIGALQGELHLQEQNMCNWSLPHVVDSVISFCDCLNYIIDEDELLAALYATYNGLRDGGTFIFDVHPISRFEQYAAEQPFTYDENGVSYIWWSDYDEEEHIISHDLSIFVEAQDGRYDRIDEQHVQRAYHPQWLKAALASVGFSSVHIHTDFSLTEQQDSPTRLFFVAVK